MEALEAITPRPFIAVTMILTRVGVTGLFMSVIGIIVRITGIQDTGHLGLGVLQRAGIDNRLMVGDPEISAEEADRLLRDSEELFGRASVQYPANVQ